MLGRSDMDSTPRMKGPRILLIEPHLVLRQTIASTVRSLGMGDVHQAGTIAMASKMIEDAAYGVIVFSVENDDGTAKMEADLKLLELVRTGQSRCAKDAFVILSTTSCDPALLEAVKKLLVNKILIKPFRVRDIIDTLSAAVTVPPQREAHTSPS